MIYLKLISERDENLKRLLLNNVAFVRPFSRFFKVLKKTSNYKNHFLVQTGYILWFKNAALMKRKRGHLPLLSLTFWHAGELWSTKRKHASETM